MAKRTTRKAATKPTNQMESLAPQTEPTDPDRGRNRIVVLPPRQAGVYVNEDTAMTQSAVWACIRVISESLAGMPWLIGHSDDGINISQVIKNHPLSWLLNQAPNPETTHFTFREVMWAWAVGWGNGYAEIERDVRGVPVNMWQIHPSRVRLMRDQNSELIYEVQNDSEAPSYLPARNVYHIKGPTPDGYVGWSVIRNHARLIGLAIAQEESAASLNQNDSTPGGILKSEKPLGETALNNLRRSWNAVHQGPSRRRTVAILEDGVEWQQTGINPADAQLIEQMQLTPSSICRIFRVPPHKIADLTRSTNNNIEHQDREFVNDTLRPWAERAESEANMKLLGRNNQGRIITAIDMDERERGDTNARTQHTKEMFFCGAYSVDEVRVYHGKPPLGPEKGGDKRFVQSSMVLLEEVGTAPEPLPRPKPLPPASPPRAKDEDEPDDDDRLSAVQAKSIEVVTDACRRMLKQRTSAKKLQGEPLAEWQVKHHLYCQKTLQPSAMVLAVCLKLTDAAAATAMEVFLSDYAQSGDTRTPEELANRLRDCMLAARTAKGETA